MITYGSREVHSFMIHAKELSLEQVARLIEAEMSKMTWVTCQFTTSHRSGYLLGFLDPANRGREALRDALARLNPERQYVPIPPEYIWVTLLDVFQSNESLEAQNTVFAPQEAENLNRYNRPDLV